MSQQDKENVAKVVEVAEKLMADTERATQERESEFRDGYRMGFQAGRDVGRGQAEDELARDWAQVAQNIRAHANTPTHWEVEHRRAEVTSMTLERLEQAAAASIVVNPDLLTDVNEWLEERDFRYHEPRKVFAAAYALDQEGHEVNARTVRGRFRRDNQGRDVNLAGYTRDLPDGKPGREFAVAVKEASLRRDLAHAGVEMQRVARSDKSMDEVIALMDQGTDRVAEAAMTWDVVQNGPRQPVQLSDAARAELARRQADNRRVLDEMQRVPRDIPVQPQPAHEIAL